MASARSGLIERDYGLKLTFPNGFRGDILSEELVVLLKKAGMYRCMVAVESASPRIQKVMKKRLKIDKVKHIVDFIAQQGVLVHGAFMLGFPSETEEEMEATIDWAASSSFHTAAFFRVIPFKGTELFDEVEKAGHQLPSSWEAYEPYGMWALFTAIGVGSMLAIVVYNFITQKADAEPEFSFNTKGHLWVRGALVPILIAFGWACFAKFSLSLFVMTLMFGLLFGASFSPRVTGGAKT